MNQGGGWRGLQERTDWYWCPRIYRGEWLALLEYVVGICNGSSPAVQPDSEIIDLG